jgi:hypothetical protein
VLVAVAEAQEVGRLGCSPDRGNCHRSRWRQSQTDRRREQDWGGRYRCLGDSGNDDDASRPRGKTLNGTSIKLSAPSRTDLGFSASGQAYRSEGRGSACSC